MFSRPATPDPTPTPEPVETQDFLPLTLVAAELRELGLDHPDDLARHVGASRITLAAGLVRASTRDGGPSSSGARARPRPQGSSRRAGRRQARILEQKDFNAAVAERVYRERVQRVMDELKSYVVAAESSTGSATTKASDGQTSSASKRCSAAA